MIYTGTLATPVGAITGTHVVEAIDVHDGVHFSIASYRPDEPLPAIKQTLHVADSIPDGGITLEWVMAMVASISST